MEFDSRHLSSSYRILSHHHNCKHREKHKMLCTAWLRRTIPFKLVPGVFEMDPLFLPGIAMWNVSISAVKCQIFSLFSYHRYNPHGDSWQKQRAHLSQPRDELKWNLKVDLEHNYFSFVACSSSISNLVSFQCEFFFYHKEFQGLT